MPHPSSSLILLCAGAGSRMRGRVRDKILEPLEGKPVFLYSIETFSRAEIVDNVVFVTRDTSQKEAIAKALPSEYSRCWNLHWATGGKERSHSVRNGLAAIEHAGDGLVFIHDAARPLITVGALKALEACARVDGNATLAHRVVDTIKQARDAGRPIRNASFLTLNREALWAVETPQVFRRPDIARAYEMAAAQSIPVTDDTGAYELTGNPVSLVENSNPNPKLTHPFDFAWASFLLHNSGISNQ